MESVLSGAAGQLEDSVSGSEEDIQTLPDGSAQALSDRAVAIIRAVDADELPPRMASAPDFYLCRMCAWSQRCWGQSS